MKRVPDKTGDPYEDFPQDQGENISGTEIFKIATALKEYGTGAFKSGDVALGLAKYQKGLRYLNEYPEAQDSDPPEVEKQLNSLRFTLHNNSALLQLKLKHFEEAQKSASNALEIEGMSDAEKGKAHFRL